MTSSKLLAYLKNLLSWIATVNKTWVLHFEPNTKKAIHKLAPPSTSSEENLQKVSIHGRVMNTVSWACDRVILVDMIPRRR
jgi:hypothetical protein